MKVLVVGSGGREHAIIKKIKQNAVVSEVFAVPGNGGIGYDATCLGYNVNDYEEIVSYCVTQNIGYVIVAPDDPLANGLVDMLEEKEIPCFGPNKAAAEIESSKIFSKNLMKKYNIPTAEYVVFSDIEQALDFVKKNTKYPIVIKADGLALGKGVLICKDEKESISAIKSMMQDKKFGSAGINIVIEEFLQGPEVSVLAFCDGRTLLPMQSSMDHKRALDNDKGLNTGGMGAIAPNPYYTDEIAQICMDKIFIPTMQAMNSEGRKFKGCLYFGLMLTTMGPKVIEYNCRFGDPETQVVLPLLKTDLFEIMQAVTEERLAQINIEFYKKSAACVVLASGGYPEKYEAGKKIQGLISGEVRGVNDCYVFHSGTRFLGRELVSSGGRVMGITAVADTLDGAIKNAYAACENVFFQGMHKRLDIGKMALAAKK